MSSSATQRDTARWTRFNSIGLACFAFAGLLASDFRVLDGNTSNTVQKLQGEIVQLTAQRSLQQKEIATLTAKVAAGRQQTELEKNILRPVSQQATINTCGQSLPMLQQTITVEDARGWFAHAVWLGLFCCIISSAIGPVKAAVCNVCIGH